MNVGNAVKWGRLICSLLYSGSLQFSTARADIFVATRTSEFRNGHDWRKRNHFLWSFIFYGLSGHHVSVTDSHLHPHLHVTLSREGEPKILMTSLLLGKILGILRKILWILGIILGIIGIMYPRNNERSSMANGDGWIPWLDGTTSQVMNATWTWKFPMLCNQQVLLSVDPHLNSVPTVHVMIPHSIVRRLATASNTC